MQKFVGFAQDASGNLLTSGTWAVYEPGTTTPVTVYNTDSTADPVVSFTIPATGKIEFYSRNRDIKVVATSGATTVTIDDISMCAPVLIGTLANRPAAGSADRRYIATDVGREYYDTGSVWALVTDFTLTGINAADLSVAALGLMPMINGKLEASVASSALTISLKTQAGATPSAADPVLVLFRNPTLTSGDYQLLKVTSALSLTVSSGSTLGTTSGLPWRLYVAVVNDNGTPRLGVYNPLSASDADLRPLTDNEIMSSTAEGGAGAADSAQVLYTGTGVSSKAIRVIGYLESTQATAGTWATAPSKLQLAGPGVPRSGDLVQTNIVQDSAVSSGATTMPLDDTIPQNTEGILVMSATITPVSGCNVLSIDHVGYYANGGTNGSLSAAMFKDSDADAIAAGVSARNATANAMCGVTLQHRRRADATALQQYDVRAGAVAGTTTFNGNAGARIFGGRMASVLGIREIFA